VNISALFIRRPIATILLTIAVAIAGILAFQVLPVSPLPQMDSPTIVVNASLPGASPDVMASSVATPLERQFGHIAGVTEMVSNSATGSTNISLQFDLGRNINAAARDVQAAISAARSYLPTNLPSNPTYRKVNAADAPIAIIALSSKSYDQGHLYDTASTILAQKLSQIQGVGQVTVGGSSLPAVRVELNPMQLSHYGISASTVASFLRTQNAHTPTGTLSDGDTIGTITINDQLSKAADYRPLIVAYRHGAPVKLSDVAEVIDSIQSVRASGYVNGEPSVSLIIFKEPGANIIDTIDSIKESFPALRASIPAAQDLTLVLDRTTTIRASLHDVERTLMISILLVVLVVFVFLRNWRATIIPGIAVPVSLIGTFAVMYLLGYSLDNLSLMALTISTGFVIDDAIVVMENIARYLEQGMSPMAASLAGAREVGFTVLSITISLLAVFIPILLMGGIIGRLFREFSVTLSIAILISMVLSLTTTPMLCSLLLKAEKPEEHGRLYRLSERGFALLLRGYERSLAWVLRSHAVLVLALLFLTVAANAWFIYRIPKGFFPQQDTGVLMGGLQGPQDVSFARMQSALNRAVAIVRADPAVQNVVGFTGGQGSTNSGFLFIALKPLDERKVGATAILDRLRPKLAQIREAQTFLQAAQDLRVGGRQANAQYQYTLQADSVDNLKKWAPQLENAMKQLPGVVDVNSDLQSGGLEAYLTYDRMTAARLGLTPRVIDNTLNNLYSQSLASTIYKSLNQYHVVVEAAPQFTQGPESLDRTYVQAGSPGSGGAVPLSAISKYQLLTGPLSISHSGLYPSTTISFNLAANLSLGDATTLVREAERRLGMPASVHGTFSGTAQQYQQSLSSQPLLIATAILAVYIVLGILYESLVHPVTILTTLPSASLGAVMTLMLFGADLNIISLIGIVLLIGIVKKNAIMMIDFALQLEREHGLSTQDSIFQACLLRFRPILMTTAAALFGAVPLAFGSGIGSELRRPLGLTIIGGLVVSQVLTLYTTPVIYLFLDRLRARFSGGLAESPTPLEAQGEML
jgi:multidrug efflux pump